MASVHISTETLGSILFAATATITSWVLVRKHQQTKHRRISADISNLKKKLEVLKEDGADKLQIIMDFDRTITTYWGPKGGRGYSCHGIAESLRGPAHKAKADALNQYYYPIEVNPSLTREEKIPYMIEWYKGINALLIESCFNRADIETSVAQANVALRPGVERILDMSRDNKIPLLIFSAGIGDILEEVIKQQYGDLPPKSAIVSNWMKFNSVGELVDWTEPLIHMFNKDDSHLRNNEIFAELCRRPNVLLIGDSLGDATMADGVEHGTVLKVGLLNDNIDLHVDNYLRAFDWVLTGDSTLDAVADVIEEWADKARF